MENLNINARISEAYTYKFTSNLHMYTWGIGFLLFVKGSASLHLQNETLSLKEQDVLVLPPGTQIALHSDDPAIFVLVQFNYPFFKKVLRCGYSDLCCSSLRFTDRDHSAVRLHICRMALLHAQVLNEQDCKIMAQVYAFFDQLKQHHLSSFVSSSMVDKHEKRSAAIEAYIQQHYADPISLQDVADAFEITPQYLSNYIKKRLGKTFLEYLQDIRLDYAFDQLRFTDDPPIKIAVDNGYPNPGAFIKGFTQAFGSTPSDYRKQHAHRPDPIEAPDFMIIRNVSLLEEYLQTDADSASKENHPTLPMTSVTLSCDVRKCTSIAPTWKSLINLGFAINFDKPDFRQQLTYFQSHLHFEYGRIQGIFELTKVYQIDGHTEFDFSKAFLVIDFLKSVHLKPHFEIGNKPMHIYKTSVNTQPSDNAEHADDHYDYLKQHLPQFLNHCINRYGFEEVGTWHFELWRQYNNSMTSFEDPLRYMRRFRYVYHTIKKLVPEAQVGGPGHNTYADPAWLHNLLDMLVLYDMLPDFISIFVYPYECLENGQVILSLNPDIYHQRITTVIDILHALDLPIPCWVTEYSSYLSNWNRFNDSNYQAAFIIRETLRSHHLLRTLGYWTLSDTSFEYTDTPGILFGGNGLISRDGIRKPGFYAFRFLESLGPDLISQGASHIVTASGDRSFRIIFYNYCYFREHYCMNHIEYQLLRYPYSAFEDKPALDIRLTLKGLPAGKYRIRRHTLNQQYGSVLNEWQKVDELPDLTKSEIDYLKHVSIPNMQISFLETSGELALSALLQNNDVVLIEIDFYM